MRTYTMEMTQSTCHAVPFALFWLFAKINFLLNMVKKEPNFNILREFSNSELVLEVAKVEPKYEKQQEKRRIAAPDFLGNFAGN